MLEGEIKGIEHEAKLGYRSVDAVEEDIRAKRDAITSLRRKYLNSFYYF
jgi:hypothetical protein